MDSLKSNAHTGRTPRLTAEQLKQLDTDLQKPPSAFGYDRNLWDGLVLSRHLEDHYSVCLKVRQCQRILRKLGYTLQRPQTKPYGSDPKAQETLKNLANIRDNENLSYMEAEYTSIRLAELVTRESVSRFDFVALCDMHYYIFQDIFDWAGNESIFMGV